MNVKTIKLHPLQWDRAMHVNDVIRAQVTGTPDELVAKARFDAAPFTFLFTKEVTCCPFCGSSPDNFQPPPVDETQTQP